MSPNESDLVAELAAADRTRTRDVATGRRRRFAVLLAAPLVCGAVTIVWLSSTTTPATPYQANAQSASVESSASASSASTEAPQDGAGAPAESATPPAPVEQPPSATEPSESASAGPLTGAQKRNTAAPAQPQTTPPRTPAPGTTSPQPAPAPAETPPSTSAAQSEPQPEPTPAPTCTRWYWAGLAMHDGELMNKYNVQGAIHYLPLAAPHSLNPCW